MRRPAIRPGPTRVATGARTECSGNPAIRLPYTKRRSEPPGSGCAAAAVWLRGLALLTGAIGQWRSTADPEARQDPATYHASPARGSGNCDVRREDAHEYDELGRAHSGRGPSSAPSGSTACRTALRNCGSGNAPSNSTRSLMTILGTAITR